MTDMKRMDGWNLIGDKAVVYRKSLMDEIRDLPVRRDTNPFGGMIPMRCGGLDIIDATAYALKAATQRPEPLVWYKRYWQAIKTAFRTAWQEITVYYNPEDIA